MTNSKTGPIKLLKPLLQLLVTALALYLVLKKTDVAKLAGFIRGANLWYLLLALLFFNISKVFNAIRLNRFFKAIGIELSAMYNLKLYYLGMFYNLFLPGGIGGDGHYGGRQAHATEKGQCTWRNARVERILFGGHRNTDSDHV